MEFELRAYAFTVFWYVTLSAAMGLCFETRDSSSHAKRTLLTRSQRGKRKFWNLNSCGAKQMNATQATNEDWVRQLQSRYIVLSGVVETLRRCSRGECLLLRGLRPRPDWYHRAEARLYGQ